MGKKKPAKTEPAVEIDDEDLDDLLSDDVEDTEEDSVEEADDDLDDLLDDDEPEEEAPAPKKGKGKKSSAPKSKKKAKVVEEADDDLDDLLDDDEPEEEAPAPKKGKGKKAAASDKPAAKKKSDPDKLEGLTKMTEESGIITFKEGSGSQGILILITKFGADRTKVLKAAQNQKFSAKYFASCDPVKKYAKVAGIINNLKNAGYKMPTLG